MSKSVGHCKLVAPVEVYLGESSEMSGEGTCREFVYMWA